MATLTPAALIPFSSFSTAAVYTASSAATTGIIRTITFNHASATAQSVTVTLAGADAAAQRLIDSYPLTVSQPSVFNGWWVQPVTAASLIGVKTTATALSIVTGVVSGYAMT
jgi:hypothetical protein